MKLSGSNSNGRHLRKNVGNGSTEIAVSESGNVKHVDSNKLSIRETELDPYANAIDTSFVAVDDNVGAPKKGSKKASRVKRVVKKTLIGIAILFVTIAAVLALDIFAETGIVIGPPSVNPDPRPSNPPQNGDTVDPQQPVIPTPPPEDGILNERVADKYTFLILGIDEEGSNSDVIMSATFDTNNRTLNVVSIPRDTLVNVSWNLKLANSIYPVLHNTFRSETDREKREELVMAGSVERFASILGYNVDFWVTINMRGFAALIDAIGGVDFEVPVNMNYHDPYQDLHINYSRGMHRGLTGRQSLEILRFRGYASADIQRINTQQLFLTAAVEQILAKRSSINVSSLASIFLNHVRTDIPLTSLVWFGLRFLELEAENVRFAQVPGNNIDFVTIQGASQGYVTIYIEEWLEMLNEMLNPLANDLVAEDLSILTRGAGRRLYVTDGNWAGDPTWGSASRGPSPNATSGSSGGSSSSGGANASGGSGNSSSSGSSDDTESEEPSEDGETGGEMQDSQELDNSETGEQPNDGQPPDSDGDDRQQPADIVPDPPHHINPDQSEPEASVQSNE